jgi:hypothetical protein
VRRLAAALVAAALVSGACSDGADNPREYIEPVPFDPAVDLADTTTTAEPAPTTTALDAGDLFGELVEQNGFNDVPTRTWGDFAAAGCVEGIWDRGVNFAFAEDFMRIDFADVEPVFDDPVLVAQLLWLKSVDLCEEQFPSGAIDVGPPTRYVFPLCRQQLEVWRLPWADEAGAPDIGQNRSLGIMQYLWLEPEGTLVIAHGADRSFDDDYAGGSDIGEVNGFPAKARESGGVIEVLWREHEGHCGVFRLQLGPPPETDDLAAFLQSLLQPPESFFANAAEIRMARAAELVEGYRDTGGEPSHGGRDAAYSFEDDAGWFDVHAVSAGIEEPAQISDTVEVDGTMFELFYDDQGSNIITRGVSFVSGGYRISIRTTPDDERLMAFALEFRRAWLAAGPAEG